MLNTSIVLYNHSIDEIESLVRILMNSNQVNEVFLIDNSPKPTPGFQKLPCSYIFNKKNLGYGAAHNIAIRKTIEQNIPYHLVVNPDIEFETSALVEMLNFMNQKTNVGLLMPKVLYPNGDTQFLCKLLPTPYDLLIRRFIPANLTKKRTSYFELRDTGYNRIMDVPYLSGCFMFLRTQALKEVGLFDERFFMYPEDIDLTRRIHQKYRTIFYPHISIIHHHAQASYRNVKPLLIHTCNLIKYFNKWGWFIDAERKKVNKDTLGKLKLL